ncbi:peptidoglycan-binding protein [Rhodobacteraceae bacterium EhC02]|jgi:peptidoglycan hydrolase-like protein with peptidoglycan-binding domain|nr:peptidoglycan-binding protein [Rhodobacteraceae bacterium EhC02]
MTSHRMKAGLVAALCFSVTATQSAADNLGAAIVGGILGGVIVNEANKNRQRTTTRSSQPRSTMSSATREQNRQVQTSLNYFGFPAGTADGVMGQRSRAAAAQYQAHLGFPATGELTPYERDFLISSYSRAQIGGPQVMREMNTNPQGVKGLLVIWRNEAMGGAAGPRSASYGGMPPEVSAAVDEIAASSEPTAEQLMQRSGFIQLADLNGDGRTDYLIDTSVTGSSFWCGASSCSVMVFASTPQGYARNDFLAFNAVPAMFTCRQGACQMSGDAGGAGGVMAAAPQPTTPAAPAAPQAPATVMAAAPAPAASGLSALPIFGAAQAPAQAPSLASHCSKVSLLTNSNGGFVTLASMTDPDLALSEQFCLTRTYAIGKGEEMVAKVQGLTQAQVDQQCDAFGPVLAPFVAMLDSADSATVRAEVQTFVLGAAMTVEQLQATAEICLYTGYRRDRMEVALGSALLLVGIGQTPYAELVGHHLSQGFGVNRSDEGAQDWYAVAVDAVAQGASPVFAPGQPERMELLRAASASLGGAALPQAQKAALPAFKLD